MKRELQLQQKEVQTYWLPDYQRILQEKAQALFMEKREREDLSTALLRALETLNLKHTGGSSLEQDLILTLITCMVSTEAKLSQTLVGTNV